MRDLAELLPGTTMDLFLFKRQSDVESKRKINKTLDEGGQDRNS